MAGTDYRWLSADRPLHTRAAGAVAFMFIATAACRGLAALEAAEAHRTMRTLLGPQARPTLAVAVVEVPVAPPGV